MTLAARTTQNRQKEEASETSSTSGTKTLTIDGLALLKNHQLDNEVSNLSKSVVFSRVNSKPTNQLSSFCLCFDFY